MDDAAHDHCVNHTGWWGCGVSIFSKWKIVYLNNKGDKSMTMMRPISAMFSNKKKTDDKASVKKPTRRPSVFGSNEDIEDLADEDLERSDRLAMPPVCGGFRP